MYLWTCFNIKTIFLDMRARNFIGDADKIGNDYSDAYWSGDKVVEFGIDWNKSLTFTILSASRDQKLYITDNVTFTISEETKKLYKEFKLFVYFPKHPGKKLEIQIGNRRQLIKTFWGLLTAKDVEKDNTLTFELECIKNRLYGEKIEKQIELTIETHPGDTYIFTKII